MRIALFTETFYPQVNGVANALDRLITHLHGRGAEVCLVAPRPFDTPKAGLSLKLEVPAIDFPFYPEYRFARFLPADGRRQLRNWRPDLIHVVTEFGVGWSGRWFAQAHDVPLVSSFHTDFPLFLESWGAGALAPACWWVLRNCHAPSTVTMCPSTVYLEKLRAMGFHDRLRIWSRGVDTERFSPAHRSAAARERLCPGYDRIVTFVGRVNPEKRMEVLMEAFTQVRAALPGEKVALLVVGDGPLLGKLRDAAPEGVFFTGYLAGEALSEAYAAGDVFCSPSDTETFGNVVLEAMASGVPVVVANRGGVLDVVDHGDTGLFAAAGEPRAFTDAIASLLRDEPRRARMARLARAEAERRTWEPVLDAVLRTYADALARHGRPCDLAIDPLGPFARSEHATSAAIASPASTRRARGIPAATVGSAAATSAVATDRRGPERTSGDTAAARGAARPRPVALVSR